jgi:hypothetical protein
LNNCTIGNGKVYYYNGLVDKYQLKCVVIDDTFYFDFSANSITDVIKQQMWILKHTKGIEYKIEFVCLWEMFELPSVEQLNEFAKVKQKIAVPIFSEELYHQAIEEMKLSTGLGESSLHPRGRTLEDYLELMASLIHTRLSSESLVHYATIIHNHHYPVVEEVITTEEVREMMSEIALVPASSASYNEAVDSLVIHSNMSSSDIVSRTDEDLSDYLASLEAEVELPYEDIDYYGTIVYNYHNGTQE